MSARQERIARKQRQREGTEVFVHLKPTKRVVPTIPITLDQAEGAPKAALGSRREVRRRLSLYGDPRTEGAEA